MQAIIKNNSKILPGDWQNRARSWARALKRRVSIPVAGVKGWVDCGFVDAALVYLPDLGRPFFIPLGALGLLSGGGQRINESKSRQALRSFVLASEATVPETLEERLVSAGIGLLVEAALEVLDQMPWIEKNEAVKHCDENAPRALELFQRECESARKRPGWEAIEALAFGVTPGSTELQEALRPLIKSGVQRMKDSIFAVKKWRRPGTPMPSRAGSVGFGKGKGTAAGKQLSIGDSSPAIKSVYLRVKKLLDAGLRSMALSIAQENLDVLIPDRQAEPGPAALALFDIFGWEMLEFPDAIDWNEEQD